MGKDENEPMSSILECIKDCTDIVVVELNGKEVKIPIYFSALVLEKYLKEINLNSDDKLAFFNTVLFMYEEYKGYISEGDDIQNLEIESIIQLPEEKLQELALSFLKQDNNILKAYDEEKEKESSIYTALKNAIKLGSERYYKEKKFEKSIIITERRLAFENGITKLGGIFNMIDPISLRAAQYNISNNNSISKSLGLATSFVGTDLLASNIKDWTRHVDYLHGFNGMTDSIASWAKTGLLASELSSFRDIYKPAFQLQTKMNMGIAAEIGGFAKRHQEMFGAELRGITQFYYNDKLFNFLSLTQDISSKMSSFFANFANVGINGNVLDEMTMKRIEVLSRFNWIYASSLSMFVANYIYENRETITQQEVDKLICDYYKEENYMVIREILKEWKTKKYYMVRIDVLEEGIDNHINNKYTSSVSVLMPQKEGLIRDFMREEYNISSYYFKSVFANFKEKVTESETFIANHILSCFEQLHSVFDPHKPNKDTSLNRNKVAHGAYQKYEEVDSLRIILYLDELSCFIESLTERVVA